MNKETLLQTYVEIETKTFIRTDKTQRLDELISNIEESGFVLSLADTLSIIKYLTQNNITIRHPLFLHVIYPALTKGINENNIDAIKSLIHLFQYFGNYENLTKDNKFSSWKLLTKGLQLAPTDKELLNLFEKKQRNYFEYTLHELPSGVLYDSNGATIEQCEELLNDLIQYEEVCERLKIDQYELINECKFYYTTYRKYLTIYKDFKGFADYLKQYHQDK